MIPIVTLVKPSDEEVDIDELRNIFLTKKQTIL